MWYNNNNTGGDKANHNFNYVSKNNNNNNGVTLFKEVNLCAEYKIQMHSCFENFLFFSPATENLC